MVFILVKLVPRRLLFLMVSVGLARIVVLLDGLLPR